MRIVSAAAVSLALASCDETSPGGGIEAAKTPDGLPPSVEDVCDDYEGAAYGLCTAYCEAMDCDYDPHHASDAACERVAANFTKKTGDPLPCEGPCIDAIDDAFDNQNPEGLVLPVLVNDVHEGEIWLEDFDVPEGTDLQVDPAVDANVIVGHYFLGDSPFAFEFDYTACCAEGCDTAHVTVMGS